MIVFCFQADAVEYDISFAEGSLFKLVPLQPLEYVESVEVIFTESSCTEVTDPLVLINKHFPCHLCFENLDFVNYNPPTMVPCSESPPIRKEVNT